MGKIKIKSMKNKEKVEKTSITEYPGLFIGRLSVDVSFRDKHIGSHICHWILSKARRFSNEVGCRYVTLQAIRESVGFYKKCKFECAEDCNKEKVWMYRKIS